LNSSYKKKVYENVFFSYEPNNDLPFLLLEKKNPLDNPLLSSVALRKPPSVAPAAVKTSASTKEPKLTLAKAC
jgi:hypothetical protein